MVNGIHTKGVCRECERVFDLTDEDEAAEFFGGHDCERDAFFGGHDSEYGRCDFCDEPYLLGADDHNMETGNHYECEEKNA